MIIKTLLMSSLLSVSLMATGFEYNPISVDERYMSINGSLTNSGVDDVNLQINNQNNNIKIDDVYGLGVAFGAYNRIHKKSFLVGIELGGGYFTNNQSSEYIKENKGYIIDFLGKMASYYSKDSKVYVQAGLSYVDIESNDASSDLTYGAGITYGIGTFDLGLDWKRTSINGNAYTNDEIDRFTLSVIIDY